MTVDPTGRPEFSRRSDPYLELKLVLNSGEPLEGTLGPYGSAGTSFHGWVELMSAVEIFRRSRPT